MNERILIIEDDQDIAFIEKDYLLPGNERIYRRHCL